MQSTIIVASIREAILSCQQGIFSYVCIHSKDLREAMLGANGEVKQVKLKLTKSCGRVNQ